MSPETVPQDTTNYYRGVLTRRDFVRPEETEAHNELAEQLGNDLAPETALEEIYFAEALTASWRLNRLAKIEAGMGDRLENQIDPMANPEQAKLQQSVDQARTRYTNLFRRAVAEIRSLQKERRARPARPELFRPEPAGLEPNAMEQKTEQTQSEPTALEDTRKILEFRNARPDNYAEYRAFLVAAYHRALAREAALAEIEPKPGGDLVTGAGQRHTEA